MAWAKARLSTLGVVLGVVLALSACGGEETPTGSTGGLNCPLGACVVGTVACSSDGTSVNTCMIDVLTGCGAYQSAACGDNMACEDSVCVSVGCPADGCTIGESTCTDGGEVSLCAEGPDGCGFLTTYSCGERALCEQGVCVGDCVDLDGDGYGLGCEAGPDCDDGEVGTNPQGAEVCDGLDNDCDSMVDEDFDTLGEGCTGGEGACEADGVLVCNAAGDGVTCDAVPLAPTLSELCGNSVDDDCDGEVDEGFDTLGDDCMSGLGVCARPGSLVCTRNGAGVECDARPGSPEGAEVCDGIDNDCDGELDETWPEVGQECGEGIGRCVRLGEWVCNETGTGVDCTAETVAPLDTDLCGNGIDDDCDGETDEGYPRLGEICRVGVGACQNVGVTICSADGRDTACSASSLPAGDAELCGNNADDDCDGETDEGFSALGTLCEAGQGACGTAGVFVCSRDLSTLECSAQSGEPGAEVCDGFDNDCNDLVDETFVNKGQPCTAGVGICSRQGVNRCSVDQQSTICGATPGTPAPAELCGNNTDDDCDGSIDEGFEMRGTACTVGLGVCARTGQLICNPTGTALLCNANPGPDDLEVCDGQDNNCNGEVDENEVCGATCAVDMAEPNDTTATAHLFSNGQVFNGTLCYFDVDYFEIGTLLANTPVSINLLFEHARGDLQMEVYRNGNLEQFAYSTTDNERAQFVTSAAGSYTFAIFGPAHDAVQDYRLSMQVGGDCADDIFESNNRREDAMPIRSGQTLDGIFCASDGTDWFDLGTVGVSTQLDIDLLFSTAFGNFDMYLYGASGGPVLSATSTTDNETLSYFSQQGGHYYVEVRLQGNTWTANYRLAYVRQDDFCVDDTSDGAGQGDDFATAIVLQAGRKWPDEGVNIIDLRACPNDLDVFNLGVFTAGQRGQVNVIYDNEVGLLGVDIVAPDGQVVAVDDGNGDHLRVPFTTPTGGTYHARVFAFGGRADYRISNAVVNHGTCKVDVFENDNFFNHSSKIGIGELVSAHACRFAPGTPSEASDVDWYDLGTLTMGTRIQVGAYFLNAAGDIDIRIYLGRADGTAADPVNGASGLSVTDNEIIDFLVPSTGRYLVTATLYDDGPGQSDGNNYRLLVTTE